MASSDESSWWQEHIPLVLSMVTVAFIVSRVLVIARFDQTGAVAIFSAAGPADVITGTLIASGSRILAALTLLLFIISMPHASAIESLAPAAWKRLSKNSHILRLTKISALIYVLLFLSPVFIFLSACMVFNLLLIWLEADEEQGGFGSRLRSTVNFLIIYSISIFLLFSIIGDPQPWIPAQELQFASGAPRTGYVLNESASTVSVLWDEDRVVETVLVSEPPKRKVCQVDPENLISAPFGRLIEIALHGRKPHYPICPKDLKLPND